MQVSVYMVVCMCLQTEELCIENCKPIRAYITALMADALIDMSVIKIIIIISLVSRPSLQRRESLVRTIYALHKAMYLH